MINPLKETEDANDNHLILSKIDTFTNEQVHMAIHTKLSAIRAIGLCFEIRQVRLDFTTFFRYQNEINYFREFPMADFATIFISLIMALSSYAGVGRRVEPLHAKFEKRQATQNSNPGTPRKDPSSIVIPYIEAKKSLRSFLVSKGCHSLAHIVNKSRDLSDLSADKYRDFSDFVSVATESLCQDFPLYLNKISSDLRAFNCDDDKR